MHKKIRELYKNINFIGFQSTYNRDYEYVNMVRNIWLQIVEFVDWFMQNELPKFDDEIENEIKKNIVAILSDCEVAFKYNDTVLMRDALEEGMAEYLKLFLNEDELKEIGEENVTKNKK